MQARKEAPHDQSGYQTVFVIIGAHCSIGSWMVDGRHLVGRSRPGPGVSAEHSCACPDKLPEPAIHPYRAFSSLSCHATRCYVLFSYLFISFHISFLFRPLLWPPLPSRVRLSARECRFMGSEMFGRDSTEATKTSCATGGLPNESYTVTRAIPGLAARCRSCHCTTA